MHDSMEKIHACFCAYMLKMDVKAQKHACFCVFSPFSAPPPPPLHHNDKGLLVHATLFACCYMNVFVWNELENSILSLCPAFSPTLDSARLEETLIRRAFIHSCSPVT